MWLQIVYKDDSNYNKSNSCRLTIRVNTEGWRTDTNQIRQILSCKLLVNHHLYTILDSQMCDNLYDLRIVYDRLYYIRWWQICTFLSFFTGLIYKSILVTETRVARVQVVHLNTKVASWLYCRRTDVTSDYVWIGSNFATDSLVAEFSEQVAHLNSVF